MSFQFAVCSSSIVCILLQHLSFAMLSNLPRIGFGTFRLHKDHAGQRSALEKGLSNGIKIIDTARTYLDGESEELIGEVLQKLATESKLSRSEFRIISKSGYVPTADLQVLDEESNNSHLTQKVLEESLKDHHQHEQNPQNHHQHHRNGQSAKIFQPRFESSHEMLDLSHIGVGDTYHSIHPSILQQQLDHSLDALQTDYLDSFLLHNPEHYIQYQQMLERVPHTKLSSTSPETQSSSAVPTPIELQNALPQLSTFPSFEEKIFEAFVALEEAAKEGKIRSYGISSNWLAYPTESNLLKFKEWPVIAANAYKKVNGIVVGPKSTENISNFKTIQFPANLLETFGAQTIAPWAKANGLNVLVNRPLDAYDINGQWRLATYRGVSNTEYQQLLAETLKLFENRHDADPNTQRFKNNKFMSAMLKDLDRERYNFSSIYHYQQDFSAQIMPMLMERMTMMKDPNLLVAMQVFLETYEFKIREHCSAASEQYIEQHPKYKGQYSSRKEDLQHFALKTLLQNKNIDCVLHGMTRSSYVDQALQILQEKI